MSARIVNRVAEVPVVVHIYSPAFPIEDFVMGHLERGRTPGYLWDIGAAPPSFSVLRPRPTDPSPTEPPL